MIVRQLQAAGQEQPLRVMGCHHNRESDPEMDDYSSITHTGLLHKSHGLLRSLGDKILICTLTNSNN